MRILSENSTYGCSLSLSLLFKSVEPALGRSILPSILAFAGLLALSSWNARAQVPGVGLSQPEPEPLPESAGILTTSDYFEAKQFIKKNRWEEAAIVLRSVHRKSPEFTPAAIDLAIALTQTERREEALDVLIQSTGREKKGKRDTLIRRVRVLSRLFFTKETFQTYQDGLNLVALGKYRAARERFEKTLSIEPDNVEVLTRIGQCSVLDRDFDSAAERLRLARKLNPFEPEVRLWLGRALHQRGEIKEAVAELRAVAEELPSSELAPVWLAEALSSLGQKAAAMKVLDDDSKAQPFHLLGLMALAKLQAQTITRDPQILWSARKNLQLALSRVGQYSAPDFPRFEDELGLDIRKSLEDNSGEIQKLLAQVESRLDEFPPAGHE